jgi:hypothetical protein
MAVDGRDIDPALLADTQAYLKARRRGEPPSPRLVKAWEWFYLACSPVRRGSSDASLSIRSRRRTAATAFKRSGRRSSPGFASSGTIQNAAGSGPSCTR